MIVPVGTIFEVGGAHWKVTGPKRPCAGTIRPSDTYPVIKCSKLGKEFTKTNGFHDKAVERWHDQGLTWMSTYNTGESADTSNAARGIRRRRIRHLETTIAEMQKELEGLLRVEAAEPVA